ncbi:DUF1430 domain-containing protein [Staphylococcus saccharolyticus]|uniref:DUF1430 domain-containing protein n=1 Tax=Staphylococcus saccharolyticus TaxID=33028 RepID=UPI001EE3E130|nr:DUF1430 domain-containing protein [Staphylococcus saccharolyticus]
MKDDYRKVKTPLSIIIIYVKNDSKYPTYNKDIGEKNNTINAPIAIVETGNTSIRNYQHYMTECYFFESKKHNPYESIKPLLKKYNLLGDITSIQFVYDTKVDDISNLKTEIVKFLNLTLNTFMVFITSMLTAIHLYFTNWKYHIFIKYSLGYSTWRAHKFIFITLLNILLLIMLIKNHFIFGILICCCICTFEAILLSIEFMTLNRKNKNEILKGKE